jgi:hypothetical protein
MQMPGHRTDGNHCREATHRNQELPQKKSLLVKSLLMKSGLAIEKVGSSEKSRESGDRKCLGEVEKSLIGLPDTKQFLRICGERVFQQPQALSQVTGPLPLLVDQGVISYRLLNGFSRGTFRTP